MPDLATVRSYVEYYSQRKVQDEQYRDYYQGKVDEAQSAIDQDQYYLDYYRSQAEEIEAEAAAVAQEGA